MLHDRTQDIPPEIMAEIFALVVANGQVLILNRDDGYPWTLGHVCSRWRQILWDTPSIWNKIRVESHRFPIRARRYTSGNVLDYIFSKIPGPISLVTSKEELEVVLEHFSRFVELSIIGLGVHQLPSIFNLPESAFALLESFSLSLEGFYRRDTNFTSSPLQNAPSLRCVEYRTHYPTYIPALLLLPWARVEVINVVRMRIPPDVVLGILRSSPHLTSCSLHTCDTPLTSVNSEIVLPVLEVLNIATLDNFDWETFLSPIITPSLTSLTLTSPYLPCAPVISLIIRSRCSLQIIDMSDLDLETYANDTDVELLFENISSVIDLCVPWPVPPSIFRQISDGALQRLVRAELCVRPPGLGAFIDMMDSYIGSPRRPFSYFYIACLHGPEFTTQRDRYLERHEAYKEIDGLEVVVIVWNDRSVIQPPESLQ